MLHRILTRVDRVRRIAGRDQGADGSVRIGETPSDAIPGRVIPLLSFDVGGKQSDR